MPNHSKGLLTALGTGIITGVADDDPSAIGTYTSAGAKLGFGFLTNNRRLMGDQTNGRLLNRADLRLHANLLQRRDETIALSDLVSMPVVRLHARRFRYPNARFARITDAVNLSAWRRLAAAVQIACSFFQAEMTARCV